MQFILCSLPLFSIKTSLLSVFNGNLSLNRRFSQKTRENDGNYALKPSHPPSFMPIWGRISPFYACFLTQIGIKKGGWLSKNAKKTSKFPPLSISRRCPELVGGGRVREGVDCWKLLLFLSFTPHPSPLPTRERELV